jgi:predicted secreted Zn-dependent protease
LNSLISRYLLFVFCLLHLLSIDAIANNTPNRVATAIEIERSRVKTPSQPKINTKFKYYPIYGKTAAELRQQMNRAGAKDTNENRRYDAVTYWELSWNYRYIHGRNFCKLSSAEVSVNIDTILPQWKENNNNNAALIKHWHLYFTALKRHELVHHRQAINAGQELLENFRNFRTYPNCTKLKQAIEFQAYTVINRYQQQDIQYDLLTDHGGREGAIFP